MMRKEFERTIRDEQLELDCHLSGYCPVQGMGTVAGRPFYFRARHDAWTFAVSETPDLEAEDIYSSEKGFYKQSAYGKPGGEEAGWMPLDEAETLIRHCAAEYASTKTR
jgi:hypothetical protein